VKLYKISKRHFCQKKKKSKRHFIFKTTAGTWLTTPGRRTLQYTNVTETTRIFLLFSKEGD
jgi:uncharacterized cupin superfamily protein